MLILECGMGNVKEADLYLPEEQTYNFIHEQLEDTRRINK